MIYINTFRPGIIWSFDWWKSEGERPPQVINFRLFFSDNINEIKIILELSKSAEKLTVLHDVIVS